MLLFLFLLFPLSFFAECSVKKFKDFPAKLLLAFCALFCAAVFCAFKYFFMPFYFITPDSFLLNFLHVFTGQIFIPLLVLTAAFVFMGKKEGRAARLENIFSLYAGFYAVYLPFRVCATALPFPFFFLFAKPLLFLGMALVASRAAPRLFVKINFQLLEQKEKAVICFSLFAALVLPAVIEALWTTGSPAWLTALLCLLSFGAAFFALSRPPLFKKNAG